MTREEEILQAKCVEWFHNTFHSERKMLHCNNNNSHNKIAGNKARALGVVAGVSDLELITQGMVHFIEMKTPTGTLDDEQKKFRDMVIERGLIYVVIRSLESFQNYIWQVIGK